MKVILALAVALVPLAAAASSPAPDEAPIKPLTPVEQEARVYEDLGPGMIDVSGYPAEQKANYLVFQARCAQCHSLARPINAPFVTKADWTRFIRRMRQNATFTHGKDVPAADAEKIVSFLDYDARIRKVKNKAAWDKDQAELKAYFKEVQQRRLAIEDQEARKKAKQFPMGADVKPQAGPDDHR